MASRSKDVRRTVMGTGVSAEFQSPDDSRGSREWTIEVGGAIISLVLVDPAQKVIAVVKQDCAAFNAP
jgi:hypothetical protein